MALGTGVHNLSLVVRGKNSASRALAGVRRDLGLVGASAKGVGGLLTAFAKTAALAFAAVAVAASVLSAIGIRQFAAFEDALISSLAIMGDVSEEQMGRVEQAARDMAKTSRFTAVETAEAFFFLASAGLDVEKSIGALPAVTQFAQAGMFDLSTATSLLTDAQAALGMKSDDTAENLKNMIHISDLLVGANTLADATTEQFAEALTNKAATGARTYGIALTDTIAILATFADNGIKGVAAGEKFFNVFRDLQKGAIKNADAFKEYGVAVFDATGNMRGGIDIIEDLEKAMEGLSDVEKKQMLLDLGFQERVQANILQLIGFTDEIRENAAALEEMGGITEEVADKQLTSLSAQMDIFKSRINDVFIELGKKLAPELKEFLPVLAEWVEKWGPKVIDWILAAKQWMGELITTVREFYQNTIVPLIEKFQEWWMAGEETRGNIVEAINGLVNWFQTVFVPWWMKLWEGSILPTLQSAVAFIMALVEWVTDGVADLWEKWGVYLMAFFELTWEGIQNILEGALQVIKGVFDFFTALFTGDWEALWDIFISILSGAWKVIKGIFQAATGIIMSVLIVLVEWAKDFWTGLWTYMKEAATIGWEKLTGWWDNDAAPWFSETWETVWSAASDFLGDVFEGMLGVIKVPLNGLLGLIEMTINAAINGANTAVRVINAISPFDDIPSIPNVSIPRLARGGFADRGGIALVGDRGPELLNLPRGANVMPLNSPAASDRFGGGGGKGLHIENLNFTGTEAMLQKWLDETAIMLRTA